MSTNNDNTQVLEPIGEEAVTDEAVVEEATAEEVLPPVTKTKKELKKERKEIKKHKKEVKKEAKKHSAKATKAQKFFLTLLTLIVIACMVVCCYSAITVTMNLSDTAVSSGDDSAADDSSAQTDTSNSTQTNTNNNTQTSTPDDSAATDSTDNGSEDANTGDDANADTSGDAVATGALNSKEAVVEYYKTAHAKVIAEAKSVTRTYDRPSNYNGVVEVGGNSTIAGIAKTLMDTFMTENKEAIVHEGSDAIKTNFPPANENGTTGLTADMISDYTCEEKDGNYIITLTLNSTEENPDDGTMASNLVDTVEVSQITDAAGDFVALEGFENLYIGSTVTATIEKETGKMTALDVNNPSYMCFGKATALGFISVENCKLGLLYEQKWTVQW
ncbi:MAG: hypothetical protein IJZ35_08795 [Clostridia bacterium]|nr:hypothetical protein [Clostridia bacterium]